MSTDVRLNRRMALTFAAGAGLAARASARPAAPPRFEVLAEGLAFPEGPVVFPDGSVVVVELLGGRITRVWNGRKEVISAIGAGPNGAQLGPDGALYVCNCGGADPADHSLADPNQIGRIERVDLKTGKFERLYDHVGDRPLSAPNDLVFDRDGGMWFTDFGKVLKDRLGRSGIYYAKPDGSEIRQVVYGGTGYNGIGLSPDGKWLYYAMNYTGRLFRMRIEGPGKVAMRPGTDKVLEEYVGSAAGNAEFDGLKVTQAGNVCVGTNRTGGVTTITPGGASSFVAMPEHMVTNLAFGGRDMRDLYLTWSTSGKVVRTRWREPGLKLNFAA